MSATRSYHFVDIRYGNELHVVAVFMDGTRREVAVFELPENGRNFSADYEFIQDIKTAYKKRFAKIY